jgi:hypothetical protein
VALLLAQGIGIEVEGLAHGPLPLSSARAEPVRRVIRKQFFCGLLSSTLVREFCFEMSIYDYCVSAVRRDVGALNIFRLLFFDAKGRLFHVSYFRAVS